MHRRALWWQRYRWPLAATGVVLALTAAAYSAALDLADRQARDRFRYRTTQIEHAISSRVDSYVQVLRGAAALFAASGEVTRAEWRTYVDGLQLTELYPGFQGFGYTVRIPAAALAAHVAAVRADGFPDYRVVPEGRRDEYHAIVFLEPFDWRNQRAFGYDMYTNDTRRAAMQRARDSGRPAVSGRVRLVQETDEDVQAGFLIYYPVYRGGAVPATVDARRRSLIGFVYSPMRADNFLRGILGDRPQGVNLAVYDGDGIDEPTLMRRVSDTGDVAAGPGRFASVRTVDLYGRRWTLAFESTPGFEALVDRARPSLVLAAGLLIAALVFWIARAVRELRTMNVDLERRVRDRTAALETANRELEEFSSSVSHDLRGPLRAIGAFAGRLRTDHRAALPPDAAHSVDRIVAAATRMRHLIDDLLALARVTRVPLRHSTVDLTTLARAVADELQATDPVRSVDFEIEPTRPVRGDRRMLRIVLENLLGNAWKFTSRRPHAHIRFGARDDGFFVEDDGAGFDPAYARRLFQPFHRLHAESEFPGTGIGLATVARIVERHGGTIRAEGAPGRGATIRFKLGTNDGGSDD